MVTVGFFHTGAELSGTFDDLAAEYIPEAEYFHQVDESVLDELLAVGELTPSIRRRICAQLQLVEQAGADLVLDTCSSTSPAVDTARELVEIPIVKIDDPMTEKAVELGDAVGVLATASSTLKPSTELVERNAARAENSPAVTSELVDDAFAARKAGDIETHDRLVKERAHELAETVDVVVLAQASMSHLESDLDAELSARVLSSPGLAMERIADLTSELR